MEDLFDANRRLHFSKPRWAENKLRSQCLSIKSPRATTNPSIEKEGGVI